jgi:hypothetical protein
MLSEPRISSYSPIAVVYLARRADGLEAPRRFFESYRAHIAGEPHDLVIVFKGFSPAETALVETRKIFSPLAYQTLESDDNGIDITAYQLAAEHLDHRYLCLLNTFSEIACDEWLSKLMTHLRCESVGLVGATGSYESLSSSMKLLSKVVWLCASAQVGFDRKLASQFRWLLTSQFPAWLERSPCELSSPLTGYFHAKTKYRYYDRRFEEHWRLITQPGGPIEWAPRFPSFPNPHIRSNAFMLERQTLLALDLPKVVSKIEGCEFESGATSLTARLRRRGLATLVVGKDGIAYDIGRWTSSRTFRLDNQQNVIISDNQVRNFNNYSPAERATHVAMTWGDYVSPPTPSLLAVNARFPRATVSL